MLPSPTPGPTPRPGIKYDLTPAQRQGARVGPAVPIYKLVMPAQASGSGTSPHLPGGTLTEDTCAACHQTHTGRLIALGNASGTQAALCYRCHASGATFDVQAQFAGKPANNPASASYYSHPVSDASASLHVLDGNDEFAATSDRHAVCADCHQPHNATDARPQQSTTGWTASGDIAAASGVAVTNGPAGSAPTYQLRLLNAGSGSLTYEYQLCMKCHSGWTTLPVRSSANPSWWALDKGIEMNPANTAFHPVEASGRNISAQMAGSLAGSSPFKAWDLSVDSVVRCTQCHGDPATVNQTPSATPLQPAADAYQPAHASPNRGILIAPYRDRVLKPIGEAYDATDFALCYLCHSERPFSTSVEEPLATDTAFPLHGAHIRDYTNAGTGTSIDHAGDGSGFAICAECHFRIHSNALAYQVGDTAPTARSTNYPHLVDFAPNVIGNRTWNQPDETGTGSCALKCHGFTHIASDTVYFVAPETGFTASPTSGSKGASGLVVTFTDATRYINPATATYAWTFGDGGTDGGVGAAHQNPTHTYTLPGSYTVTLTVTRPAAGQNPTTMSMAMTRTSYITVTP